MRGIRPVTAATLAAFSSALALPAQQAPAPRATLIQHARVFDGERLLGQRDVLIVGNKITAVAASVRAPAGAEVVDAAGKTLLPGLIDAHTHAYGDGVLREALVFGVTTELEMFGSPTVLRAAKSEQASGKASGRADLYSAGTLVTAPKGHGTEYGIPIPTIVSPDSAQAFVDARIAEGSDWIKIVYDDGRPYGISVPTLSKETMRAVVAAAHARRKLAVVHIGSLQGAREAIEVGADGLVHTFEDAAPGAEFGRFVASHHAFVIPTLAVNMSVAGTAGSATLVKDERVRPYLLPASEGVMQQGFPKRAGTTLDYGYAEASVKQLEAAHVPILAGTDAPNPGTAHGSTLHRELELLVKAGLTPAGALAAATSVPARIFHLGDRGRIAAGLVADVVLVDGDPMADITATRAIAGIWKDGVRFDRAAYARAVASAHEKAAAPLGSEVGDVSDFDDGSLSTKFGAGWARSTDEMAQGKSTATLAVVDGGAHGSAKALSIEGTISDAVPYAWAGAMFSPAKQPMQPADLSSKREIRFWTKGDGKTYRIMVFAQSRGMMPVAQPFVAGPEWKEYVFPISSFSGVDGHDLMALLFVGGPAAGAFSLRVDDVRFR